MTRLAPHFFDFEPTLYFSDGGNVAGRLEGSYDLQITQRLVLQPEAELNFYNKSDPGRGTGSCLSDLDTGCAFAIRSPGSSHHTWASRYTGKYGDVASFARQEGEAVDSPTFVFGLRVWQ
jgi:copper resistance protein B